MKSVIYLLLIVLFSCQDRALQPVVNKSVTRIVQQHDLKLKSIEEGKGSRLLKHEDGNYLKITLKSDLQNDLDRKLTSSRIALDFFSSADYAREDSQYVALIIVTDTTETVYEKTDIRKVETARQLIEKFAASIQKGSQDYLNYLDTSSYYKGKTNELKRSIAAMQEAGGKLTDSNNLGFVKDAGYRERFRFYVVFNLETKSFPLVITIGEKGDELKIEKVDVMEGVDIMI